MIKPKIESLVWSILLVFIFFRPFLSEYAFITAGFWYVLILIFCSIFFLVIIAEKVLFPFRLNFLLALFAIAIIISVIFPGYTDWNLYELFLFIPNIIIFYIAGKINPRQQKQLIHIIFLSACIISLYGIYQYFVGFNHTVEYLKRTGSTDYLDGLLSRRRIFATVISPNIFASYIVMMLFVGTGLALYNTQDNTQGKNMLYWLGVCVMAIALLLTKSLGGILTFIITFLIFLNSLMRYKGFKKITLKRFTLIMIFLLCVFILIYGFFARDRIAQFFDLKNPNNSIVQRFYYMKASIGMIKDFPLTGVGWRNFGLFYEFYKPDSANISHYSHNVFLQITAEMGPLGLVVFLAIIIKFFQLGLKVIRKKDEEQGLKIGLFFAGVAFLIHNLIELSFYFSQVALFWWIILGLISNFSSQIGNKNTA